MKNISLATVLATAAISILVASLTLGERAVSAHALGGDKVQHILGFGAIILPAALLRPAWLYFLVPLVALYGGAIELVQSQIGRDGELGDWLGDLLGLLLVITVSLIFRRFLAGGKRRTAKPSSR